MNNTALIITIIGAVNWLLVGLFKFDLVASIFGGQAAIISRIIYVIVGLAGLWCITLLFLYQCTEHSKSYNITFKKLCCYFSTAFLEDLSNQTIFVFI